MDRAVLVFSCLAYACHGRRVQSSPQQSHIRWPAASQDGLHKSVQRSMLSGERRVAVREESEEQLQLLRGGRTTDEKAGELIIVRVMTRDGLKRMSLEESATLRQLQRLLQKEHKLPMVRQRLSRVAGEQPFSEADGDLSLKDLGVVHGTMLHLELAPATATGKSGIADGSSTATSDADVSEDKLSGQNISSGTRTPRKKSTTMADLMEERASHEVVLKAPPAAECGFLCVEPTAAKSFADHMIDLEFEEKRVAFLYGRWVDKEKRGVYVDVIYEPPQSCNADSICIDNDTDASAELERADIAARGLGLTLVGVAFAHPPRHHLMEVSELASIVKQRELAASADADASHFFVGVRFRAVYEGEPIEGEVTAEAYQPTEQAAELIHKGALVDMPDELGQAGLDHSSGLFEFKMGAENHSMADISYFISRVHDLAKPYTPPAFGALRTAFPVANRGDPPVRKFHLRSFIERQQKAGLAFATAVADFQLLLHVSSIMPAELFARLCEALAASASTKRTSREKAAADIREAERWLCDYAGINAG